jgi:hypothetical protein
MSDSSATQTIIAQGPTLVTAAPQNGIKTEVVQDVGGKWLLNSVSIFQGKELPPKRLGVFDSYDDAEAARQAFVANEKKKGRPGFQID